MMNKLILSFCLLGLIISGGCIQIGGTEEARLTRPVLEKSKSAADDDEQILFETLSLLGKQLVQPVLDSKTLKKRYQEMLESKEQYLARPDSLELVIRYGKRLAFLYRYKESIEVYSKGVKVFPESFSLYRHRGHRYLTLRKFDEAIQDLEKAVFHSRELELLGSMKENSSLYYNIWYHLGLSYYMKGNYDKSISAYKQCLSIADNDDQIVRATDWLYMTYRKIGNEEAAGLLLESIHAKMKVYTNKSYLNRLLMYKGLKNPEDLFDLKMKEISIESLTVGYGVGNWYYYNGQTEKALAIFSKMMESPYWQAFGFIAAEVELANLAKASS